jgi:hypothetical protein
MSPHARVQGATSHNTLIFTSLILPFRQRRPGKRSRYAHSLRAGRSGEQIPVVATFAAPVQNGPRAHPASCTTGTGSFPWVKRLGRVVDHPPLPSALVKERVQLFNYSLSLSLWALVACSRARFSFIFTSTLPPTLILQKDSPLHTLGDLRQIFSIHFSALRATHFTYPMIWSF